MLYFYLKKSLIRQGGNRVLTKKQINTFPKAELHCHLDGSIRPETLIKIAQAQHLPIETDSNKLRSLMQAPDNCEHLVDYLQCFDYVRPYLQTELALEMAAYDVMEQAYEDGVVYLELRFAPSLSLDQSLTVEQTIRAVASGIAKAEKKYPIIGNILIIGMRTDAKDEITAIFKQSLATKQEKIVGLDLAGPEDNDYLHPHAKELEVFVADHSIQLTLHAGECGCVHNIYDAIDAGATRIGHGIALKEQKSFLPLLLEKNVCIEGCPTSNVQTKAISSYADYPLREWLARQLAFCINTDNRTVSNTTLTNEYYQLAKHCQLTAEELRHLNLHAMTAAFASDTCKMQLQQKMKDWQF